MSRSRKSAKQAGANFETAVAKYFAEKLDDDRIERRHLSGTLDRGDITGIKHHGERVVIECKNTARLDLAAHVKEAEQEAKNDNAAYWAVVQKRSGVGIGEKSDIGHHYVILTLDQYTKLLEGGQREG